MSSKRIDTIGLTIDTSKFELLHNKLIQSEYYPDIDLTSSVTYNHKISNTNPIVYLISGIESYLKASYIKATCLCDLYSQIKDNKELDFIEVTYVAPTKTYYTIYRSDFYKEYREELYSIFNLDFTGYDDLDLFQIPITTISNHNHINEIKDLISSGLPNKLTIKGLVILNKSEILFTEPIV